MNLLAAERRPEVDSLLSERGLTLAAEVGSVPPSSEAARDVRNACQQAH